MKYLYKYFMNNFNNLNNLNDFNNLENSNNLNKFFLANYSKQFDNLKMNFEDKSNKLMHNVLLEKNNYQDYYTNTDFMNFIYGQYSIKEINKFEYYYHCNCNILFDSNDSLKITLRSYGLANDHFNNFQTKKHFYNLYLDIHKFYENNVFVSDQYLKLKSFKSKINSIIFFFKSNYDGKLNRLILDLYNFYNQNNSQQFFPINSNNISFNVANNKIYSISFDNYNIVVKYFHLKHFDIVVQKNSFIVQTPIQTINYFYDLIYFINQTLEIIYKKK